MASPSSFGGIGTSIGAVSKWNTFCYETCFAIKKALSYYFHFVWGIFSCILKGRVRNLVWRDTDS